LDFKLSSPYNQLLKKNYTLIKLRSHFDAYGGAGHLAGGFLVLFLKSELSKKQNLNTN